MPYISYVELNIPNTKEAADFYRQVLGWEPQAWGGNEDYLVVGHGDEPGIDSALRKAPDGKPLTVAIATVPSIDASIQKVQASGGVIVVEKFPIEGVGYAAYFTDPGGLLMGLHEVDENAKE